MDTRYNHKEHEAQLRGQWKEEHTYDPQLKNGPEYSVDTPPPTVSGSLHMGHIFSYTQTDIIARFKRMMGHSVYYPFGFDDNGLATERFVEKVKKVQPHEMGRSDFTELCRSVVAEAEKEFFDLWQQMGLSVDWRYTYSTIASDVQRLSQASFIELYRKGYIYRSQDPALYCSTCRTAVSQAELDDAEEKSQFFDIIFKDESGNDLVIATTRPELLPSCVALLFHPDDERYKKFAGRKAFVPLYDVEVPIITDESVIKEKGTGLVMCCTYGDTLDVTWQKRHNLPYRQSIGFDGRWLPSTGVLQGLKYADARKRVVELLHEQKLLISTRDIVHVVNVHERCKKAVELVVLPQWFVKILEYKAIFLAMAENITWYPASMKVRYVDWVTNLSWDWCISRQRLFGIPFPAWHCNQCSAILLAPTDSLPIDPRERAYPGNVCDTCGSSDLRPDTDVMDTWNTSSITPYIIQSIHPKMPTDDFAAFTPVSLRPQAHDIIRTWAFYTIVKAWMHSDTIPWKDIVISGHVLSKASEKLSKSTGNANITPTMLLEKYPADAIRYWCGASTLGQDSPLSEDQMKQGTRTITKLWNAFRFVEAHLADGESDSEFAPQSSVNAWLVVHSERAWSLYKKHFDNYQYSGALQAIDSFFWQVFCDNYLELIKHQLFNPEHYDAATVRETKNTLHLVGKRILQMYAPFMPYVTDSLYRQVYGAFSSLHVTEYAAVQRSRESDEKDEGVIDFVVAIVAQVRKLKSEHQLALNAPLRQLVVVIAANDEVQSSIEKETVLLQGVTHARSIVVTQASKPVECSLALDGEESHATVSLW